VAHDADGYDVTGNPGDVAVFDQAIDALLRFQPAVAELAEQLDGLAMGRVLSAYLSLVSTEAGDVANAVAHRDAIDTAAVNERERAHVRALDEWIAGRMFQAGEVLDELLMHWPTDTLALAMGHQIDFFTGNAMNLRDRVGRSLGAYPTARHRYGYVLGMQSFGLEEAGHYDLAEATALNALAHNGNDVWAIHGATHVYEMRGQVDTGIKFLADHEPTWGHGTFFDVHTAWHRALFALERDDIDIALDIFDTKLHHANSAGLCMEMVDAAALGWRLSLDGVDIGDRWSSLADAWSTKTPGFYVFNDLHAVMAYVGAGRLSDAHEVVNALEDYVEHGDSRATNHAMTSMVGLSLCHALVAFGQDRYDDVVTALLPLRNVVNLIGGSHAQRDAVQRTLLQAALHSGQSDIARALVSERLALRPTSRYAQSKLLALTK
jgi:hypothetical protein